MPPAHRLPNKFLTLVELPRMGIEAVTRDTKNGFASLPSGRGQPFLAIPGFLGGDWMFRPTCTALAQKGYVPYFWGSVVNRGFEYHADTHRAFEQIRDISRRHGGSKVTIVGHSLAGVLGASLARFSWAPQLIERVIKVGSPDAAISDSCAIAPPFRFLYKVANRSRAFATERAIRQHMNKSALVPETTIYSDTDGVIAPWVCALAGGCRNEVIKITGSHFGLPANLQVAAIVADRLSLTGQPYRPFEPAHYPEIFPQRPKTFWPPASPHGRRLQRN